MKLNDRKLHIQPDDPVSETTDRKIRQRLKLLREDQLGSSFCALSKQASEVVIAVPFWGEGAIKSLGLGTGQKVHVICNLSSNACNPNVIADLKKLKGVKVFTHPRLHAKIYATKDFCIIGSSNAS